MGGHAVTAPPSQVWYPLAGNGNSTSLLGSNEQQERGNFEQGDDCAELDVRALSAGDLLQERPRRGSLTSLEQLPNEEDPAHILANLHGKLLVEGQMALASADALTPISEHSLTMARDDEVYKDTAPEEDALRANAILEGRWWQFECGSNSVPFMKCHAASPVPEPLLDDAPWTGQETQCRFSLPLSAVCCEHRTRGPRVIKLEK